MKRQHQWDHTKLRRRMLYGLWEEDLYTRLASAMGIKRADVIGRPDMSANVYAASIQALAALYEVAPKVTGGGEAAMNKALRDAGLWAQMQRTQRDCIGMREMLVRVDARKGGEYVNYSPVPVDMVEMVPDPNRPEFPIAVKHAVRRVTPNTKRPIWTWDAWDISGDGLYRVLNATNGEDITHHYKDASGKQMPEGGLQGTDFPDLNADGSPYLRYVIYHAARTGNLLDSYHGCELVEGALNVGVLWTFFSHCTRNASWPQRYVLGAVPAATNAEGETNSVRDELAAGPTFVLELAKDELFDGQPTVGQWAPSSDPQVLAQAIGQYERRLAAFAGLNPSDIQRTSGDPRSGYAIAIGREGRREAQRRFGPVFQPSDEELLAVTAKALNAARGTKEMDVDGWRVEYQALPPTKEEQKSDRENVLAMLRDGLISKEEGRAMLGIVAEEEKEPPRAKRLIGELTTVLSIVQAAAGGTIPAESAKAQMRIMFGIEEADAAAMLAGAGTTFKTIEP